MLSGDVYVSKAALQLARLIDRAAATGLVQPVHSRCCRLSGIHCGQAQVRLNLGRESLAGARLIPGFIDRLVDKGFCRLQVGQGLSYFTLHQ